MSDLSSRFPAEHILLDADCRSKKRVFERVSAIFENSGGAAREEIFRALINRERLGSTAVGNGGAIPRGRLAEVDDILCAVVRLKNPLQYDAGGEQGDGLVQNMFFLIAPLENGDKNGNGETPPTANNNGDIRDANGGQNGNGIRQSLMDKFSALLINKSFINALSACNTPAAAQTVINEWQ